MNISSQNSNIKIRNSNNNANEKDKVIKIRLLYSSIYLDIIDQLPRSRNNIDNWIIAYDYYN